MRVERGPPHSLLKPTIVYHLPNWEPSVLRFTFSRFEDITSVFPHLTLSYVARPDLVSVASCSKSSRLAVGSLQPRSFNRCCVCAGSTWRVESRSRVACGTKWKKVPVKAADNIVIAASKRAVREAGLPPLPPGTMHGFSDPDIPRLDFGSKS